MLLCKSRSIIKNVKNGVGVAGVGGGGVRGLEEWGGGRKETWYSFNTSNIYTHIIGDLL